MIYEYNFNYETYGVLIIKADSKKEAFEKIKEVAETQHNFPKKIQLSDINEIDLNESGGIIFYKSGEYEE